MATRPLQAIRRLGWWIRYRIREVRGALLILVLAVILDPLQIPSTTERLSQEVFPLAAALFYETELRPPFGGPPRSGSAPITVVRIDKPTVGRYGGGVLPDDKLAQLLTVVLCAGPKAVFVDFSLVSPRPSRALFVDKLLPVVRAATRGRPDPADGSRPFSCDGASLEPRSAQGGAITPTTLAPIYFADEAAEDSSERTHPDIVAAAPTLPISWPPQSEVYALRATPSWRVPTTRLASGCEAAAGPGLVADRDGMLLYPALELYRLIACAENESFDVRNVAVEMAVIWAWRQEDPPRWYGWLKNYPRPPNEDTCWEGVEVGAAHPIMWWEFAFRIFPGLRRFLAPESEATAAPYTPSISARDVLSAPDQEGCPAELVRLALRDQVVLIGYDTRASSDTVVSPIHGRIAGIFIHAMALDNLWRWHGQVWQELGESWQREAYKSPTGAALIVLISCSFGAAAVIVAHCIEHLCRDRVPFPRTVSVVAFSAIVVVVVVVLAVRCNVAPIDGVGLISFIATEKFIEFLKEPRRIRGEEDQPASAA